VVNRGRRDMRALRYLGPGRLAVEDVPVPSISSGEALVRVRACGLCATDVKTYRRGHPRIAAGAVLGHEMVGTIAALGEAGSSGVGAELKWKVGDRVAVPPYIPCGACDLCLSARQTLCADLMNVRPDPGGFAEFVRVPERIVREGLVPLPGHVEFASGTFVEPLACVVHGFSALCVGEDDSLVVLGDGPMGQLHVELGRLRKASPIVLVGATDERLAFARRRADVVLDVRVDDVVSGVRQATGSGAAGVAVCVGDPGSVMTALALVRPGGAVNVFAGMPADSLMSMDLNRIHYEEVKLLGTFGSSPADFSSAANLIAEGRIDVSPYITARVSIDGAIAAFDRSAGNEGIKTIIVFNEA
jgi:L-iditol 2-dehydrogenase